MAKAETQQTTAGDGSFKTTHWSAVLEAGSGESAAAEAALARLCQAYWHPIYAYIRRRGKEPEDAKDLTQEFFARLLEKQWLAQADPMRGRFRSFLLSALNHFLANEWRRARAAKRGGSKALVSLDDTAEAGYLAELASELTPEKLFERRWALSLFDRALGRLRKHYAESGEGEVYAALKDFLSTEASDGDYGRVGQRLGMTGGAVAVAVHRLRQRYRELVREEIAETVASPAEVEAEIRSLLAALG